MSDERMDNRDDFKETDMLFVCREHLELAIDIVVDEFEKAPIILTLEQAGLAGEFPPQGCCRCEQLAQFTVS